MLKSADPEYRQTGQENSSEGCSIGVKKKSTVWLRGQETLTAAQLGEQIHGVDKRSRKITQIYRNGGECRETEQEHDTEGRYRPIDYRRTERGRNAPIHTTRRTGLLFCSVAQNRNTEEHVDVGREDQDYRQYE